MHHGVRIQDAALIAAATLSHRYISDRFLPDKAVDLIDEAASRLKIELDFSQRKSTSLSARSCSSKWRGQALKKEKDAASKERFAKLEKELADIKEQSSRLKAQWQKEKEESTKSQENRRANRATQNRTRAGPTPRRPAPRFGDSIRTASRTANATRRIQGKTGTRRPRPAQRGSHRGGHREGRLELDRHSGFTPPRGRTSRSSKMEERLMERVVGQAQAIKPCRTPSGAHARVFRTKTVRLARSCFLDQPASGRRNSPRRSPSFCSTTSAP